jgi:hypothetical protein
MKFRFIDQAKNEFPASRLGSSSSDVLRQMRFCPTPGTENLAQRLGLSSRENMT